MKLMFVLALQISLGQQAFAELLSCQRVVPTIVKGVPTVIRITYENETNQILSVPILRDPFMTTIFSKWECDRKSPFEPRLGDFFIAVPESVSPAMIQLGAGKQVSQLHAVLTPHDAVPGDLWKLNLSIRLNKSPVTGLRFRPSEELDATMTTTVEFAVADTDALGSFDVFDARKTQAFLTFESGKQNLGSNLDRSALRKLLRSHSRGSSIAGVMIFIRQLTGGYDASEYWFALKDARPEIRLLRNFAIIRHFQGYGRSTPLTPKKADELRLSLKSDEPLKKELESLFLSF